ncbi:sigma-54 interaction domain-containing protein [Bacillus thermotolerans]|uniref:Transcriptional regulator BkdR of isoleucine and valine catabolism operon n=1 Tax=Bacillus thermotolerans TaxID=1221996 RepID=A0A0F5IBJ1_BACTR|nr:sigma-54-dependent Fis family transcriptional regulator [Bacillus thermotolerans]KKB42974.1 Transcriptional regulator BkdR of isoleucine and valine catabolism operon [Bacillus thermotolerans]KKB43882.1 Transcriptional regulator BkdR of isoleucine and valine catabolism operon [Bacillus thermotolerans]
MQTALIVGGGQGGLSILKILRDSQVLQVMAITDVNEQAPALQLAKSCHIETGRDWRDFISRKPDLIIEVTGDSQVFYEIRKQVPEAVVIPGSIAYLLSQLLLQKETLIKQLRHQSYQYRTIFESIDEGMVVIDREERIILFNESAARMLGISKDQALGQPITEIIPYSRLPEVLQSRKAEFNREHKLSEGAAIIVSRFPMVTEEEEVIGALALFRDITKVVELAKEVTNLKEIQTMLEAIISSSDDAISVVDEQGRGLMINPAYTRLTGLSKEEVIGKPATIDISEGESVHLQVLASKKPVRGVKMYVGPKKKEVVVNVAPIIVDDKLKGSVGVIHDLTEIQTLTKQLDRARQIIRTLEAKYTFEEIIGDSDEMKIAVEQAKAGANTPATVLLRGESGTGKELFAHAIHNASSRRYNKFVRVNCAALSESLLESELFGYEDGAFSGARRGGKRGLFEEAHNGSIFLDEIGELNASMQAKLLRVLQEQEIVRVGGTKAIDVNVRVIAATNVNLEKAMAEGAFREDLYYRLNRMPIQIPPLRNRKEDIPLLCERLIAKINQDYGRSVEGLTPEAMEILMNYSWPGNVRELENVLGRAMIFLSYSDKLIDAHALSLLHGQEGEQRQNDQARPLEAFHKGTSLQQLMDEYEEQILKTALARNQGNKTATAKDLNISVRSLYYKLEKYNLQ